jgi:predicted RNA-binding Zn ribbon-like protein
MGVLADGPIFFTGNDAMSVAVDLLNTVDLLATPADRLTTVEHLRAFLVGHERRADDIGPDAVELARRVREQLRAVWQAGDVATAVDRLNSLLARQRPHPRLECVEGAAVLASGDPRAPSRAAVEEVVAAVTAELVGHGTARLGTCAGDPCRCVFLDRSRNRSRRYCCEICTNREAAAAYRRRARAGRRAQ